MNFLAVDRAMDYFQIDEEERIEFWNAVRSIAGEVLQRQYEAAEAERKNKS